ncbi:MAG: hypothetical protein ACOCRK_07420 [bacterium]
MSKYEFKQELNSIIKSSIKLSEIWEQEYNSEFEQEYPFNKSFDEVITDLEKWHSSIK